MSYEDKIKEQAQPYLLAGERVLAALIARPRGATTGQGGDVKELVSEAPLTDVQSIEVKRLLVGKVVTGTVRGTAIKLEVGGGGDAKGLADEFARVKTLA